MQCRPLDEPIEQLNVEYIDKPFAITELPLDRVYVLDNYLPLTVWRKMDQLCTNNMIWSKTNQVGSNSPTGLPSHSFWGSSIFQKGRKPDTIDTGVIHFMDIIDKKIRNDFGFDWIRFQYMGLNSQTVGCHGTTHSDCDKDDAWNLSFLFYYNSFWNREWGGSLRFYSTPQQGLDGRDEHIENNQLAEVEFKPNRLLMFDGRIPHGADAPKERARYMDRRSLVLRGDEVKLTHV